jgi:hypothetical protein
MSATGVGVRGLLLVLLLLVAMSSTAHGQAFCDEGQTLASGAAFSALQPLIPDVIGEPTECEHAADNGDRLQQTTSGLAFVQADTQAPNFTNGSEHWTLVDGDLAYRAETLEAPSPPVALPPPEPAPPPPPPPALAAPAVTRLPFHDATLELARPYLYSAKLRCTFGVEVFERASNDAALVIAYNPNVDDPVDKPNVTRLILNWPGPALGRTAVGAVASAQVRDVAVRWTSYTDRVVQDVIVPSRPPGDRVTQELKAPGLVVGRDSAGGFIVTDGFLARFLIRAPSAVDSRGRVGTASLTWNMPSAMLVLEPSFAGAAVYPVTVSLTTEFGGMYCYPGFGG